VDSDRLEIIDVGELLDLTDVEKEYLSIHYEPVIPAMQCISQSNRLRTLHLSYLAEM
jgi:hypothetical protein